jgi:hypothetical protein
LDKAFMLTAPYDHPLNLTTQAVLSYGSWAVTAVLLAIAVRKDLRYRSPFFVFLILSAMVAALAEPLYDVGFMLLFYTPGIWSTFSAFGIPQPVWAYSGYVVLYSGVAMFICESISKGLTPTGLYKWAGLVLLMSMAFEIIGIQGGTYTYWGPHAFRIFDYPLAIGVLETAQVICFSLAAAELRRRTAKPLHLLGLFVIFPCTFYMANFGAGAPLIIALHLDTPSPILVEVCSAISICFAVLLIQGAARLLPAEGQGIHLVD